MLLSAAAPSARAVATPASIAVHFRTGSNTKTFVVSVSLRLADEKKLALDEPVADFHPGVAVPNAAKITVRQSCDVRSGLFELFDVSKFAAMGTSAATSYDEKALLQDALAQKPYFAPGQGK